MATMTTLEKFNNFTELLRRNLDELSEVIGLVVVGSTAETSRVDEWSDHDFFVITKPGHAEKLRQDISWLPRKDEISFSPRETAHGLKVVYRDGQVLEFAVFEDAELELAGANDFAVLIDKQDISSRMSAIVERSKPGAFDFDQEFELFLSHLLIGVGRARRGEILIAGQQIRSYAENHLLGLIRACKEPEGGTAHKQDSLNRYRRFEQQYPKLGAQIEMLQEMTAEQAAEGFLGIVNNVCREKLDAQKLAQIAVVRERLNWI